ncbi:LysM peptidoglycan-binding domain-containing protein [Pseudoduganella lutea]|uniref:LysM domain-containing protein n=1 Tax=Pseudoduganella lutea TaxID=321985 RepID=A0A4P6KW08_9BURK|nr:LysM domain-containing protein [Pseudoduganella lutea]QBE63076.1 LysM domain-containing protein [Pseudoduganella lutea]
MKNFSTVGTRLLLAMAFSGASAMSAAAQDSRCEFRPNAPDQHTVARGDTLWDIAGTFLQKPWCWPRVWGLNQAEIADPHWIYPGQVIWFDRAAGRLRLGSRLTPAEPGTVRLSPRERTEGLGKDAIPAIPPGVIEPFLAQPLIVESDELKDAPRIVATAGNRVFLGKDDKAYVRGNLKGATSFQAFRPGKPLRDPVTKAVVGHEAHYLGTLALQKEAAPGADVHTFIVTGAKEEMGAGDLLMRSEPVPIQNYVPHPPAVPVNARVLAIYDGVVHAGQNHVVSINRGKLDGLDVGATLELYHVGQTVADRSASKGWHNLGNPQVRLPDEQVGSLFIFRVFKHVSYGLIMQATEPVVVGDVARTPE